MVIKWDLNNKEKTHSLDEKISTLTLHKIHVLYVSLHHKACTHDVHNSL